MTANAFKKAWFKLATDTETETEAPNSIQNPARAEQKRTEGLVFFCSLSPFYRVCMDFVLPSPLPSTRRCKQT